MKGPIAKLESPPLFSQDIAPLIRPIRYYHTPLPVDQRSCNSIICRPSCILVAEVLLGLLQLCLGCLSSRPQQCLRSMAAICSAWVGDVSLAVHGSSAKSSYQSQSLRVRSESRKITSFHSQPCTGRITVNHVPTGVALPLT